MVCDLVLDDGIKALSVRIAVSSRESQWGDGGRFGKARRGGLRGGIRIRSHLLYHASPQAQVRNVGVVCEDC